MFPVTHWRPVQVGGIGSSAPSVEEYTEEKDGWMDLGAFTNGQLRLRQFYTDTQLAHSAPCIQTSNVSKLGEKQFQKLLNSSVLGPLRPSGSEVFLQSVPEV